ncbi:MAG: flagellar M-ring protein FliF [Alphaproteobacteria bacterium]|nr:MAG: flagellar M-ring protein FliF [Alphaproteobacteria bacterium]
MNSFVATLQQLGPARLGVMGAILLGLLMFFVFISMRITTQEMKLLYTDLSSIDSGAVAAKLEESQIPYEISSDGSRILVPGDEVGRARMLLAAEGLPNGGSIGYELFDKQSGFGTTNFVQNINQVRALEGELARTISSLNNIRSARVHIVLPQRQKFSRKTRAPSASVVLGVNSGSVVDRQQIVSVQSLIASAVPSLKSRNVSVIDSNGNLLAKGGSEDNELLSMKADDLRKNHETRLQNKIEEQVGRIVGYNKVTAIVTVDMNFDRINTSEELYNPEGQVLRSTQSTQESSTEREPIGSDVSIGNNLPGIGGDLLADQSPSAESTRNEDVANYEISKTIKNTVFQSGRVEKLHVAVLVDGRYVTDEEGVKTYEERTAVEMEKISALIRTAIGIDEDRGDALEVTNLQFAVLDAAGDIADERMLFGFEKSDLIDAAEIMVVAIMVILVVLLVLQPMVTKLMSVDLSPNTGLDDMLQHDLLAASSANPALAPPPTGAVQIGADGQPITNNIEEDDEDDLINIQGIEGRVKASTVKKVEEIVENYPDETVSVIRSWMTQES